MSYKTGVNLTPATRPIQYYYAVCYVGIGLKDNFVLWINMFLIQMLKNDASTRT